MTPNSRSDTLVDVAALAGAVVLFAALFVDWYAVTVSGSGITIPAGHVNAWGAFGGLDLLLALAAGIAGAAATLRLRGRAVPEGLEHAPLAAGALASLLIAYRLLDPPGVSATSAGVDVDISRLAGGVIALAAALTILATSLYLKSRSSFSERR